MSKDRVAAQLASVATEFGEHAAEIVPVSATTGQQVDVVIDVLAGLLEPGPAFYPDGELTDEPEETLMAEFIREAALEGVRDELPHSLAVVIESVEDRPDRPEDDPMVDVYAVLYVERDSQRGIVIGKGGERLKRVSTDARKEMEGLFGGKVWLETWVKVKGGWADDERALKSLGYE